MILESDRLRLRPPCKEDLDPWTEMYGDAELNQYTGGALTSAQAWLRIMAVCGSWTLMGFAPFSIETKSDGRWAGCAGPWHPPDWPAVELGWRLARWAHGKGFATEAAALAMDWTFGALNAPHVIHTIDMRNRASIAVAERLGSRLSDEPPPVRFPDCAIWKQSAADWRSANRSRFF